jgi:hypothetical protein
MLKRARRYYLLQRLAAAERLEWDMAGVWRWKQEKEPGIALGDEFPYYARLAPLGYTTHEDLDGAVVPELMQLGFTRGEAQAILAAVQPPDSHGYVVAGRDRIVTTPGTYVVI